MAIPTYFLSILACLGGKPVRGVAVMGRVGYGPSLSWAEFVMGRDVQLPPRLVFV